MVSIPITHATRSNRPKRGAAVLVAACLSIPLSMTINFAAFAQQPASHDRNGSTSLPQPLSHADLNKGGANNGGNCGAYCSTRDGSPSLNGNGGGAAIGKPCAGCVGKADNKNPPGQAPSGPADLNAGYECDRNHGIGRSNPAHTGCVPHPVTCIPPAQLVNGTCTTPPKDCKGVVGGTATTADCTPPPKDCKGIVGGNATAAECTTTPPTDCKGVIGGSATASDCITNGGGVFTGGGGDVTGGGGVFTGGGGGTVVPVSTSGSGAGAGNALPFTGSNIRMLTTGATLLLLAGLGVLLAARKHDPATAQR